MYEQLNPCYSPLVLEFRHEHNNKNKQQECDMCFCLFGLRCVVSPLHKVNSLFTPKPRWSPVSSHRAPPCTAGDRIRCNSRLSRPTVFAKTETCDFSRCCTNITPCCKFLKGLFFSFFPFSIFILVLRAALHRRRLQGQRSFLCSARQNNKTYGPLNRWKSLPTRQLRLSSLTSRWRFFYFMKRGTDGNKWC